jgi:mono/diheme cytochrome c family protein
MSLQFFFAMLCSACVAGTAKAGEVDFKRDIVPIFKTSCVMCHLPGAEPGGLALHPKGGYANLVGVKSTQSPLLRVTPGSPEDSYLYRKLVGTQVAAGGTGERMPFGESQLSNEQIDTIRRWIEDGAKSD